MGCVELAIFKAYTKYADTLAFTRHGMTLYELKLKAKEDAEAAEQLAAIEADTQKAKAASPVRCSSPTASSPSATAWTCASRRA